MLLERLLKRLKKYLLGYYLEIYYINGPDNLPAPLGREQETAIFMRLRFGLDGGEERTQKEVADIIGISQSYISRLEKKIIRQLREEMQQIY